MRRLKIVHETEYNYRSPVTFGEHRAMIRPREGHDLHIVSGSLRAEPEANVRWLRDFHDNSIAVLEFLQPGKKLFVGSEVLAELHEADLPEFAVKPLAQEFPFQYPPHEQVDIIPFRVPSYPYDGPAVQEWLLDLYRPGKTVGTAELLDALNTKIFRDFRYERREEVGVQLPCETLSKGSGSCRDYAVFMMEAARHWGFAARFVTGYIQMEGEQHGATHAWTEIYLPGAGWRGYDPTNNKLAGLEHVAVGVGRAQEKTAPLTGTWSGSPDAFLGMHVKVQVSEV